MTRAWQLELPDSPTLSPNSRVHWSRRAEAAATWRHASAMLARQMRVLRLDRVVVTMEHGPRDRRRRDADSLSLVGKWCVDGLVDAGVLDDDDSAHVSEVRLRMHPPRDDRQPIWLLTVQEDA